jgi:hypothetical protein
MSDRPYFRINAPQVVSETIDGEAVVVNLATGTYYSITGDSILLWDAIVSGANVEEIAAAVSRVTESTAEDASAAVAGFCQSLAAQSLICEREDDPVPPVEVALTGGGAGLLAPSFDTYSDMQDLVLLDPVHEVDDRGWPNVQQTA